MNIILIDKKHGISRSISLDKKAYALLFSALIAIPAVIGFGAYWLAYQVEAPLFSDELTIRWQDDLENQQQLLEEARVEAEEQLLALKVRMAEMQARLVRLDALGERLMTVARLPGGEFDFGDVPPIGGPESQLEEQANGAPDFMQNLIRLSQDIESREEQLTVLERLLTAKKLENDAFLAGRPIRKGWLSSHYGFRADPFTGKRTMHKGVDFAAKDGSDIISTASGVVTWSGKRYGYGLMIEVSHGNGYLTRYGHVKELLVEVGDIVHRGQRIGLVGSTGRSTGPHVHYEVLANGAQVNPERFISRISR